LRTGLDVSASAAETLGITGKGVAKVKVDVVERAR
jgi:rare lipoprotein A (peptidoglycan hydrolase)